MADEDGTTTQSEKGTVSRTRRWAGALLLGAVRRLGVIEEVAMVGGVAKNRLVMAILQQNLRIRFADLGGFDPQIIAAYGAALLAGEGCSLDTGTLSRSVAERLHREEKP